MSDEPREPEGPESDGAAERGPEPKSCCPIRRKVLVGILSVLPEEACGVPDSELADVVRFDLQSGSGRPVIAFRFCPWCGKSRGPEDELRIVDVQIEAVEEDDEESGPDLPAPEPEDDDSP